MVVMERTAKTANEGQQAKTGCITGKSLDWKGQTVAIIASGPTAKKSNIALLEDKSRVIVINESYQLCRWADVLYACDGNWWVLRQGVVDFHGLKICAQVQPPPKAGYDPQAWKQFPELRPVIVERYSDDLLLDGRIGAGGNSGFQAINLAVMFGAKRILLIGYDMRVDLGEHWHPRHPMPLSNPHPEDNIRRWIRAIDGAAGKLRELGVEVINCSPVSKLAAYRKMSVEEVVNQ